VSDTKGQLSVVLLFGGRSSEHGVSCVTAAGIYAAINRDKYRVIPVGITRQGKMVLVSETELQGYSLDGEELPEVQDTGEQVIWPLSVDSRQLRVLTGNSVRVVTDIDVVMPMLHGPFGEDGTVQGLLELVDIPFTGSGVLGSALCMDKHMVKTVLQQAGIAVAPWTTVTEAELEADPKRIETLDTNLTYPLFVKPARAGSSVGVSKITASDELPAALETAFREDHTVLIESAIIGREIEIGVLQGRGNTLPRASDVVGEIVFSGRDFYDFEAKYLGAAGADVQLPADVTGQEYAALRDVAVRAFHECACAGYARIDFFLTDDGPVINEINTLPGFTPISMFPQLWGASGLEYPDLITELIELALETKR
jgi:D-alanine-D-alanine ligase